MEDDILDSALEDFEEEKKQPTPTPAPKSESIREVIDDLKQEINEEPDNFQEIEKMFKTLADELENNQELKQDLDNLGNEFFQEGVLKESMEELRDKLSNYISTHQDLNPSDLQRYQAQLDIYKEICENLSNGKETEAMELVAKLSNYGDLPAELMPPMPEECVVM
ncbi:hypothetical protein SteCoe_30724 [Stentor coeruleus]|uniref:Peroxin-19 n=1 Tax=Stentor coeruleus TaxID=5963 RepID=A0A1R2B316_9CILI|nr:hypothetical protein SteCoe_30724 [Stentor coeruleus]